MNNKSDVITSTKFSEAMKVFDPNYKVKSTPRLSEMTSNGSSLARTPSVGSQTSVGSGATVDQLIKKLEEDENFYSSRAAYSSVFFQNEPLYQELSNAPIIAAQKKVPTDEDIYSELDPIEPASSHHLKPPDLESCAPQGNNSPVQRSPCSSPILRLKGNASRWLQSLNRPRGVSAKRGSMELPPVPSGVELTIPSTGGHSRSSSFSRKSLTVPSVEVASSPVERELSEQLAGTGPSRTRWAAMAEVLASPKAQNLSKIEVTVQEAQFEVITSEASYHRSLSVLVNHFYNSKEFNLSSTTAVVNATDKHHLFSNILQMHIISENFLNDLESRWMEERPILSQICDIAYNHIQHNFQPFVTYMRNFPYQNMALEKISDNDNFRKALDTLQSSPECNRLTLNSFLILPLQRLTKLKILLNTIIQLLAKSRAPWAIKRNAELALGGIKKHLVSSENNRQLMDQKSRLLHLCSMLDFGSLKTVSVSSSNLVKEGELTSLRRNRSGSSLYDSKPKKLYLIVLSHILLITRINGKRYTVLDYINIGSYCVFPAPKSVDPDRSFLLEIYTSVAQYASEILFIASSAEDRKRWYKSLCSIGIFDSSDEEFDSSEEPPCVVVTKSYTAESPEHLSVQPGDIVSLKKKSANGLFFGIKTGDDGRRLSIGWFPCNVTLEVVTRHTCHRLWNRFVACCPPPSTVLASGRHLEKSSSRFTSTNKDDSEQTLIRLKRSSIVQNRISKYLQISSETKNGL